MKKYASLRALSAVVISLFAMLGLAAVAPSANAAYNNVNFQLTLDHQVVVSGGVFTARLSADTTCAFNVNFLDQSGSGTGTTLSHVFRAPVVKQKTDYTVSATCTTSDIGSTAGRSIKPFDTVFGPLTATITVVPAATGAIPNAGGPSIWWLVAGLVALLAGIVSVVGSRMRRDDAGASPA